MSAEIEAAEAKLDGNQLIDQIAKEPTLDRFFARHPSTLTDDDYRELVRLNRQARARYIEAKAK